MDLMPFVRLRAPRAFDRPELPLDLARFYVDHEGVGLGSSPDRIVRFCRLSEVTQIGWRDLHIIGQSTARGWEMIAGFRVGMSSFFDEIVYVLDAPSCRPGAILTLGPDVGGPAGSGPAALESSLVLAASFSAWLRHLKRTGWTEYGLVPGNLADLPRELQRELRHYYQVLNPGITWNAS